jgi:ActR/RegA family two-component response regulator
VVGDAPRKTSYLIVDDERSYCERLVTALAQHSIEDVAFATTYDEGLTLGSGRAWDRGILDMRLDDSRTGFHLTRELLGRNAGMRILMVTNYISFEAIRCAVAVGACDLVTKTTDVPHLLHAFARVDKAFIDTSRIHYSPPTLQEVVDEHINRVLALTESNLKLTAEVLGISRSSLYRKLDTMAVERQSRTAHNALLLLARERAASASRKVAKPYGALAPQRVDRGRRPKRKL